MISDARGGHVSPGIYTEEKDVTYSVKSLGITSLGLVGETLYGPAFENVEIEKWGDFVDYFGGTSPEKFKDTDLPKYGLPYIAKSYLEESKRLNVVRVLGLSGYYAGKAWVIYNKHNDEVKPVVVLRSNIEYSGGGGETYCEAAADTPTEIVSSITLGDYTPFIYDSSCIETSGSGLVEISNYKFQIIVNVNSGNNFPTICKYNVSLNPSDNDYIYNVLGGKPNDNTPVYVEAVYEGNIEETTDKITHDISGLTIGSTTTGDSGFSYTNYIEPYRAAITPWIVSEAFATTSASTESGTTENSNEYKPASAISGTTYVSMKKLFRFITISDGDASNYQVKVSIQNIRPDEGTFDVVIRDYNDSDNNPVYLEKFTRCSLVEGDSSYIGFKIGTADGGFEAKSKYVTVEMADGEYSRSVPAGFLGYPMPKYGCVEISVMPKYNTEYYPSVKAKKQYFGMSSDSIDDDILKYKGHDLYTPDRLQAPGCITKGFHLDSILSESDAEKTFVDGESGYTFECVSSERVTSNASKRPRIINGGYINDTIYADVNLRKFTVYFFGGFDGWDINRKSRTNTDKYKASKYNVSGSSIFKKYIDIMGSEGVVLNLPNTAITTDYYAYLAGYNAFSNQQDVDINVFATPGINWYDNRLLTEDVIEMITDPDDGRGGDALYVMDSPTGADAKELASMFDESEIDNSYCCTYYPWVMYYDASNKKYLHLPVTKDVVRNLARTDNNSYPWFAPAGIERGDVKCIKADFKTRLDDEDVLYENNVNPVKTFAQDGVKIWGNKTAYKVESPLNRINVRRLMIRVKKLVTDAAKNLIFDQYDDTLEKQFRGLVEPILAEVKSNRGISDYRIMTEVTPETKDQHILPAKILIKPTPALEYISISFVVYPESVSFEEN